MAANSITNHQPFLRMNVWRDECTQKMFVGGPWHRYENRTPVW